MSMEPLQVDQPVQQSPGLQARAPPEASLPTYMRKVTAVSFYKTPLLPSSGLVIIPRRGMG